jgi:NADH/NAD ratio-sensing transcriptional regulator Rex
MSQSLNIPSAAISRLVTYLRILEKLESQGINRTSSNDLAERAQVSAFQVRKDLAYFGRFGTRGMGYTVAVLKRELRRILGLTRPWNVVIMGMGRLGQAIAHYPGASDYEFSFVGLFDPDQKSGGDASGPPERFRALPSGGHGIYCGSSRACPRRGTNSGGSWSERHLEFRSGGDSTQDG